MNNIENNLKLNKMKTKNLTIAKEQKINLVLKNIETVYAILGLLVVSIGVTSAIVSIISKIF